MAEVLGVAASVAGLMTIADAIVRKGWKFIKDVKDAEKSVEKLVEEVNNLSGVLHSLNNVVERLEEDGRNVDPSTQIHYIESCYKTLKKIQDLFDEAMPATLLSRGDRLKWPLKKAHTKELLVEIGRHKATMILAMSAREMTALLEILAGQDDIRDGLQDIKLSLEADRAARQKAVISEERQKMLRVLGDIDARKWQDSNIRLRQPGTGVWFTDSTEFNSWLSIDESKLWINGIPGAGKTILISSVIQEIEKRVEALAFFYCDYKDARTHDPLNILGALARQLILQDERCFAQLTEFCRDCTASGGLTRSHTAEELCELIRKVSKHFKTAMVVVDGLDEITNHRANVTKLLQSLNTERGQIKTLFASRSEVDIGYELEDFVQISIAAMSSDLRLYVASEIERRTRERKLRVRDPNLKDHIMATLVHSADGMFRWVSCQMDYLCECNNDRDRMEALKKLPPDLPSSYERILERVNRSSRENQDLVKKTLHLIVYQKERLSTEQLVQALSVRDGERLFNSSSMTTEEDILHWCSSLVRKKPRSGVLELAHFTVKEFLEAIDPIQNPTFQRYRLSGDHTTVANACLNFLLCREFEGCTRPNIRYTDHDGQQTWTEFANTYSFIRYSCRYWSHHVHNATWSDVENEVWRLFSEDSTLSFWTCGWVVEENSSNGRDPFGYFETSRPSLGSLTPTPLHWAALFALDRLCAAFIEIGMNVSQPSIIGAPMYCAIVGDYAIRTYSLSRFFEGNAESRYVPTRQIVVRQLVEAGVNLDIPVDPEGQRRALTIALECDKFVVFTLLAAGARFSDKDILYLHGTLRYCYSFDEDPLVRVYGFSFPELIKAIVKENWKGLLLTPGAVFRFFSLILDALSRGCPLELLRPFFEIKFTNLFPESKGAELDSILSDESKDPQSRLIRVLSKAIRDSSPTNEEALSALGKSLGVAIEQWEAVTVSLLFEHNDDLDASQPHGWGNEDWENLFHWELFLEPQQKILKLLILHGASVICPNKEGITPIELAATKCDHNTFQLFWDSAMRSTALETSPEIIERVLCSAIGSENIPVMRLLIEELYESKFMPDNSLLEFAVRQDSSIFLEAIVGQESKFDRYSTDGRVSDNDFDEDEEEEETEEVDEETEDQRHEELDSKSRDNEDSLMKFDLETEKTESTSRELQLFYLAAKPEGSLANFTFLVKRGQPASHRYQNGNTILHILATNDDEGSFDKLDFLLRSEPTLESLNIFNNDYLTPLTLAVRCRTVRGMELLLAAGANVDISLTDNQTTLHLACYLGNKAAVEVLLGHGCQASHRNSQGQTPKDVALACGHHEVAVTIQNTIDSN